VGFRILWFLYRFHGLYSEEDLLTMSEGVILTLLAITSLAATAAAAIGGSWRLSRNTQTVNIYRENAKAWEDKANLQEKEIESLKKDRSEQGTKITQLEHDITQLRDLITSRTLIEQLGKNIEAKQSEVLAQIGTVRADVHMLVERAVSDKE
jgi:septal ring factor EnvC (AmiA/AmiB activator)